MEKVLSDVVYGFRILLKNPAFAAIAVITLGLGIGGNTAIFSVVNSVLLRPLPYANSDQLVIINETKLPSFHRSPYHRATSWTGGSKPPPLKILLSPRAVPQS